MEGFVVLTKAATLVAGLCAEALEKPGTRRFWTRFDRVDLPPLPPGPGRRPPPAHPEQG